jgi:hypothetical protein
MHQYHRGGRHFHDDEDDDDHHHHQGRPERAVVSTPVRIFMSHYSDFLSIVRNRYN